MLSVGLTGGIGSGKTIVATIFKVLGIPVYNADLAARRLMQQDPVLRQQIINAFGPESYLQNGLNRPFISAIVFSNKAKLDLLNSIVHPHTIKDSQTWFNAQKSPYAIKEAALIFESAAWKKLDKIIGVYAPAELRIKRVVERDGISRQQVVQRMNQQMSEEEKMNRCDFIIYNNESALVLPQVLKIHQQLLLLAG